MKNFKDWLIENAPAAATELLNKHYRLGNANLKDFLRGDAGASYSTVTPNVVGNEIPQQRYPNDPTFGKKPEPEIPSNKPNINDLTGSYWPDEKDVQGYTPQKGEFGANKKSTNSLDRILKTDNPKHPAKYNKYIPNDEEIEHIVDLGKKGYDPYGITLTLNDKLGKVIPVHIVKSILAAKGLSGIKIDKMPPMTP